MPVGVQTIEPQDKRPTIGAIVLAAGRSTRMGTQKLLLPLGDSTVIGRVVDQIFAVTQTKIGPVIVVVSEASRAGIKKALAGREIVLVENPDPQAEMLSSVRCGLQALPAECAAAIVALGDQPSLSSKLIEELAAAFSRDGKGIVAPVFSGKRGHPLVIASKYFGEITSSFDSVGLRGLLEAHLDDVFEFQTSDAAVLSDMDEPADYQRELNRLASRDPSSCESC